MFLLIKLVITEVEEPSMKKTMLYLTFGIILIPIGIIYFTTVLGIDNFYNFWTVTLGRGFWILAPILIWKSQQDPQKQSNVNISQNIEEISE